MLLSSVGMLGLCYQLNCLWILNITKSKNTTPYYVCLMFNTLSVERLINVQRLVYTLFTHRFVLYWDSLGSTLADILFHAHLGRIIKQVDDYITSVMQTKCNNRIASVVRGSTLLVLHLLSYKLSMQVYFDLTKSYLILTARIHSHTTSYTSHIHPSYL